MVMRQGFQPILSDDRKVLWTTQDKVFPGNLQTSLDREQGDIHNQLFTHRLAQRSYRLQISNFFTPISLQVTSVKMECQLEGRYYPMHIRGAEEYKMGILSSNVDRIVEAFKVSLQSSPWKGWCKLKSVYASKVQASAYYHGSVN